MLRSVRAEGVVALHISLSNASHSLSPPSLSLLFRHPFTRSCHVTAASFVSVRPGKAPHAILLV